MPRPAGVPVFERFFRSVASIQIDKSDLRRFREFVDRMTDEIAITGRNAARLVAGRYGLPPGQTLRGPAYA
jgi:hypothetical protein